MIRDAINWGASTVIALGLHGGAVFALSNSPNARHAKQETEISILSMPSMPAAPTPKVEPVKAARPDIVAKPIPAKPADVEHLVADENHAEALNNISRAEQANITRNQQTAALTATDHETNKPLRGNANPLVPARELQQVVKVAVEKPEMNETSSVVLAPSQKPDKSKVVASSEFTRLQNPVGEAARKPVITDDVISSTENFEPNPVFVPDYSTPDKVEEQSVLTSNPEQVVAVIPAGKRNNIVPSPPEITRKNTSTQKKPQVSSVTSSRAPTATPESIKKTKSRKKPDMVTVARRAAQMSKPGISHASRPTLGKTGKTSRPIVRPPLQQPMAKTPPKVAVTRQSRPAPIKPRTLPAHIQPASSGRKVPKAAGGTAAKANRANVVKPKILPENTDAVRNKNKPVLRYALVTKPQKTIPKLKNTSPPTRQEKLGVLRGFLGTQEVGNCFVALPMLSDNKRIGLRGFSRSDQSWPGYLARLGQNAEFDIPARLATITDAQCLVVSFAKQTRSYPNFSVSIKLANDEITSGGFLEGKVQNLGNRQLNLVLVDDEGIAQRLNSYLFIENGAPKFSLPVTSTSGPVATAQLLLAIVTDREIKNATIFEPVPVTEFLFDVEEEILEQGLKVDLAIAAFTVN